MTRNFRRTAGLAALVLALTLSASGCGGGDERKANNAYVERVNLIQTEFSAAYQRVASEITSTTSPSADGATFKKVAKTLETSVADLRKVEAPDGLKGLHNDLAGVLDEYGSELAAASGDLAKGNEARAARAMKRLEKATTSASVAFSRKIEAINAKLRD